MSISTSELFLRTKASPFSSDSEQKMTPHQSQGRKIHHEDAQELDRILAEINKKLDAGVPVDLKDYPPLFVVHYRGIHFFKQFFSHEERHRIRSEIDANTFKEGIYSPACYELAGLALGEPLDTYEKKKRMYTAIRRLSKQFETLQGKASTERSWWGGKHQHKNQLFQHYQRYVNSYEAFRSESAEHLHDCYKVFDSTKSPYVSTADHPKHAVMYALGAKADLKATPLRPGYDEKLQPKHPKVGYVQIIFHTLTSISRQKPLQLSTLQAGKEITIDSRILNERETTYRVAVASKHIVESCTIRFPAMNVKYKNGFHDTVYPFTTQGSYTRISNSLRQQKGSTFVKNLANSYTCQINDRAHEIAKQKEGYIVYLGLDGRLRHELPATIEIARAKNPSILYDTFKQNLDLYVNSAPISDDSFSELQLNQVDDDDSELSEEHESRRVRIEGYGNYFYAALLHQIYKRLAQDNYKDATEDQLRDACVQEINDNLDFYDQFESKDTSLQQVVDQEWDTPTSLMIYAAANALEIQLVIRMYDNRPKIIINPRGEPKATVYLYCSSDHYYESLMTVDDIEGLEHCFETFSVDEKQVPNRIATQVDEDAGYESEVESSTL